MGVSKTSTRKDRTRSPKRERASPRKAQEETNTTEVPRRSTSLREGRLLTLPPHLLHEESLRDQLMMKEKIKRMIKSKKIKISKRKRMKRILTLSMKRSMVKDMTLNVGPEKESQGVVSLRKEISRTR